MLLAVVSGIALFVLGIIFVDFIQIESDDAAQGNTTLFNGTGTAQGPGLDCGSSSSPNQNVSDGTKITCLVTDGVVPYFIIVIISIAGGLIIGRALT